MTAWPVHLCVPGVWITATTGHVLFSRLLSFDDYYTPTCFDLTLLGEQNTNAVEKFNLGSLVKAYAHILKNPFLALVSIWDCCHYL